MIRLRMVRPAFGMRPSLFALLACILALTASRPAALSAGDINVPDLESRVRNTGSAVPAAAVPDVPPPPLAVLPANPEPETIAPAPPASAEPPAQPLAVETASADSGVSRGPLSGNAILGAGSPGTLSGSLFIAREMTRIPGFSIDFRHAAADGYGGESAGTVFFDRATTLAVRLSGGSGPEISDVNGTVPPGSETVNDSAEYSGTESASLGWEAGLSLADRSDGFQGTNVDYYSLTRRDTGWFAGVSGIPLSVDGLTASVSAEGTVFSAFAERAGGTASPTAPVDSFNGYSMGPRVSAAWTRGELSAELSGSYGYETVADLGEYHRGDGTLSLAWNPGAVSVSAGVSLAGDSADGLAVPFSLAASWSGTEGLIRFARLAGGLERTYCSTRLLAADEPFVERNVGSVDAADWYALAGFAVNPSDSLSLTADASFRKTAFGRGVLALTDSLDGAGLVTVSREDRESLETRAGAAWAVPGLRVSCGYSGEWLDRLWRESLHRVTLGASVFDTGVNAVWELSANGEIGIDGAESPLLGAEASYRPVPNLSLTLSLDDSVSLFSGSARKRNGLYTSRSGSLSASARIDF